MDEAEKEPTLLGQEVNDVCVIPGICMCRNRQFLRRQKHSIFKVKYTQVIAYGVGKDCASFGEQ